MGKIVGHVENKMKKEYKLACLFCGKHENLKMFAHRKDGFVVGFIYSCCEFNTGNRFILEEPIEEQEK